MEKFLNFLSLIRVTDIIDIALIVFMIYKIISLIKDTRAEQVLKGFILLLIIASLANVFNLNAVSRIMNQFLSAAFIFLIVVFQPELRSALERMGRTRSFGFGDTKKIIEKTVNEIVTAASSLSRQKIGALIVIEREVGLNDIIETGTQLNSDISSELLINIFIPNTPLHDGAVIVRNNKIAAAACYLPLTNDNTLSKELGTRHRAAIGISEISDCLVVVVSEETGKISIVENHKIERYLDGDSIKERLMSELIVKDKEEKKNEKVKE